MAQQPIDKMLFELGFSNREEFLAAIGKIADEGGKKGGDKLGKGFGAAFLGSFTGVFAASAVANVISQYVGQFAGEVRKRAGEIEQENIKIRTVFGQTETEIRAWSESVRESLGLSAQQVTALASNTQDLLIPMGFQREEATGLTKDTLDLAAALSAWDEQGRTSSEIVRILTKAFFGEREELKSLGIAISEADVKTRLLEKGQQNLTGEALQQAKALATLELIQQKSSDAVNAYATNTNTAARQQAAFTSKVNESKDALAETLLPVIDQYNREVLPYLGQAIAGSINFLNGLVVAIFNVESQFLQSTRAILNQVNETNREGVQALAKEIDRVTNSTLPRLEDQLRSAEGAFLIERFNPKAYEAKINTLKAQIEQEQSNLKFLTDQYNQILKQEGVDPNRPTSSGTVPPPAVIVPAIGAASSGGSGSSVPALKEQAETVSRTVRDVFRDLESLGINAEKKAAAFGNTLEAKTESIETRIGAINRALEETIALGGGESEIAYLVGRIMSLNAELSALKVETIEQIETAKTAVQSWRELERATYGQEEALGKLGKRTEEITPQLEVPQTTIQSWRDLEAATYGQEEALSKIGKDGIKTIEQLPVEQTTLQSWRELEAATVGFEATLSKIGRDGVRTIEQLAVPQTTIQSWRELEAALAGNEAAFSKIGRDGIEDRPLILEPVEQTTLQSWRELEAALVGLEGALSKIGKDGILPDLAKQVNLSLIFSNSPTTSDDPWGIQAERQRLEDELAAIALDFPMQLAMGLKNGNVGEALMGSLNNAADFFINKLVEGIFGDFARSLASVVRQNMFTTSVDASTGVAGSALNAASLGPLALVFAGVSLIGGLAGIAADRDRSTRLAEFGVGSGSESKRGQAATINNTAAVTINVKDGTGLSTPEGRAEVSQIARETVLDVLKSLGLANGTV